MSLANRPEAREGGRAPIPADEEILAGTVYGAGDEAGGTPESPFNDAEFGDVLEEHRKALGESGLEPGDEGSSGKSRIKRRPQKN